MTIDTAAQKGAIVKRIHVRPYNASVMIFGGTAPFISTFLIDRTGSDVAPSFYLVAAAARAALTLWLASGNETSRRDSLCQT